MRLLMFILDVVFVLIVSGMFWAIYNAGKQEGEEELAKRKKKGVKK